jgi:glutathione S-transferase
MSFADLAAAAALSVLDYLSEIPWGDFPEAKTWYARIKSRPSFRPLLLDTVPGFAPPTYYADLDF